MLLAEKRPQTCRDVGWTWIKKTPTTTHTHLPPLLTPRFAPSNRKQTHTMQLCRAPMSAGAQASSSPRALAISSSSTSTSSSRPGVACAAAAAVPSPTARQGSSSSTRQARPLWSVTGSTRVGHLQQQQQRQQRHATTSVLVRALKDEQAEIDRITRQADQGDVWGSEVVGGAVKVGIVAGVVAFVVVIASLAKPMYDNTIASFPTPAEYAQYDQRVREADEGF